MNYSAPSRYLYFTTTNGMVVLGWSIPPIYKYGYALLVISTSNRKTHMNTRRLHVISLLLAAGVDNNNLSTILTTVKNSGGAGLELTYHPALLTATEKAMFTSVNIVGLPITALCAFFGTGDLDPLSADDRAGAIARVKNAIDLAAKLGSETGTTPVITGPFGFQIGKRYDRRFPSAVRNKMVPYLKELGDYASGKLVSLAHEVLQPAENAAVQGYEHHEEILDEVGMEGVVGEHHDTFHVQIWGGESSAEIIKRRPKSILWMHASGTNRHSPGFASDTVPWEEIAKALNGVDAEFPICYEGFGPEFRMAVPEIGRAYPKDLPGPVAIAQAKHHLTETGVLTS